MVSKNIFVKGNLLFVAPCNTMATDCQITLKLNRKMISLISFFSFLLNSIFGHSTFTKQDIIQRQRTYDLVLLIQPGTIQTMAGKLQ